jgi:hypothetical protein
MQSWNEVRARQERFKDARREAERDQVVLHELALRERAEGASARVMTRLGRGLVAYGWRLQERYGGSLGLPQEAPDALQTP